MMGYVREISSGRALTRADLEAMPHDGHRYELVDGVLVVSPSPRPLHQRAILRLVLALEAMCPPAWELLPAPVDVVLDDDTVLIPDVVVGARENFTDQALIGAPILAVEVLSPRTRHFDLQLKRAKFEEAGCRHYWVVDPEEPRVRCWRSAAGELVETHSVAGQEWLELADPFPARFRPADLVAPRSACGSIVLVRWS